jgi:hypothetical protein
MASTQFTLPKHWENWCSWLLGFWLCIAPWVLQFDIDPMATRTAVITGILIVFIERMALFFYRAWENWINVILGAWLVICPWILSISDPAAKINFIVVGLLVLLLAFYEIWEWSRQSGNQA